ncbi:MAG TPA: type IV toxin-antitoxin system AbiEi family antitoxin domain-containing protein [Mycobacterium sp.]|nr:type IV toxin-antitoxin system AbiEi family antitoxin domain-containing protein [Mycobacterium sp.]
MIEDYLRSQDGVVTLAQARHAGLSEFAVRRRVSSGQWRRCAPGVYFADDRPFTTAARIRAAVWSKGSRAAGSGLTAAWWLGLMSNAPRTLEVTVPRNSHGRSTAECAVRRRDLHDRDLIEHRGLRVTALALTVLEAAARAGGGSAVMDTALQRRLGLVDLQRAHRRNRGRYGAGEAQRLLCAAEGGARSEAERLLLDLLRGAGIRGWQANYPIGPYVGDVAFPAERVVIEIDGWAFHSDWDVFQADRKRQNNLALRGWQVLRFTWLDLTEHPERVLTEIRAATSAR